SRRPRALSSCELAWILSDGVRAPAIAARAFAIAVNTSVSCLAKPFTVSTRLGTRSARRCRATSTCAHDPAMASRWVTRSLRTPIIFTPNRSPIRTSATTTIKAIFIVSSFFQLVDGIDHGLDLFQVFAEQWCGLQIARLRFVFAKIQQSQERT